MKFRTYHDVPGPDQSDLAGQVGAQRKRVSERLARVKRVVPIMSGKGGVGKSYVTAGLARDLARHHHAVGVLDADLSGPTTARMLGAKGPLAVSEKGVRPATGAEGIRVFSTDLLLEEGAPVRWREPASERFVWRSVLEAGTLREFLADVIWDDLDFLLVDLPPGSDRVQDLAELAPGRLEVLAVTIPSDESRRAVSRAIRAAAESGANVLGVVENMSTYLCPHCDGGGELFPGEAGSALAKEFDIPLLARLPFVPGSDPAQVTGIEALTAHLLARDA